MIILGLAAVIYHEGSNVVFQAFLEQNQPSGSSIAVLERMNGLIIRMELCQSMQVLLILRIVFVQQCGHSRVNFFR